MKGRRFHVALCRNQHWEQIEDPIPLDAPGLPGVKSVTALRENCLGSWGTSTIHIDSLPHCSRERKPALPSDPTPVRLKTEEKRRKEQKKAASDWGIGRQRGSSNLGSPQPGEPETGWQRDSRREHLVLTIDWIPCPWGSFCSVLGRGNSLDERYEDMK